MKLFLDDDSWAVFRDVDSAMNYIKGGHFPSEMSLDHDLGTDKTGYSFIKEFVDYLIDNNLTSDIKVYVHSQNPIGKANIEAYWNCFTRGN